MATNKLVIIACGGGATAMTYHALKGLRDLGDGFADVEYHFVDMSRNNYDKIEPIGDFYQVKRLATNDRNELNGSGGDRYITAKEAVANAPAILDSIKLTKKETNVFVCVAFTASGGSGSSLGIAITDLLMEKNIPVFNLIIGDSGDALKLRNTQAVLATLNMKATNKNKCLISYYVNNAEMNKSQTQAEKLANDKFKNVMATMCLFLSGDNESLDSTDMSNFINQQDYKSIKMPAGLYSLTFHTGNDAIVLPEHCLPTVARTLTLAGKDVHFDLNVLHHKIGAVTSENAIAIFGENSFPLHIVASSGLLKEEIAQLAKLNQASAQRQNDLKSTMIEAPVQSIQDEDTDMFF